MNINLGRVAAALVSAAAIAGFSATAASAGVCPAGKAGVNALAGAPTAPKDVTDTTISATDLGKEIGVDGRELRLRRLVIQPGGIVPMHSHKGRPGFIYVESGEINEFRSDCSVPLVHPAGDYTREAEGISHYWRNMGKKPVVLISADVWQPAK